jgi:O-antigen ligase
MELITNTSRSIPERFEPVTTEVHKPANFLAFLFIALHVPIALWMSGNEQLATLHAYLPLAVGIVCCIKGRLDIAAASASYIMGSEVLWRMTDAVIYWEYAKYASIVIFSLGILRIGIRNSALPFLYFVFLIPSTILTVEGLTLSGVRNELSFNLSGPLALLCSACFFSGLSFTKQQMQRVFIAMLAPVVAIATIAIFSTFTATSIRFSDESNPITSGGFGPNQVSAMLGFGALITILLPIAVRTSKYLKVVLITFGIILLAQCLLTFSRGGMYMAVASIVLAVLVLVRQPRKLFPLLFGILLIVIALFFWILPWLNDFTGGTLTERYRDRGSTGRSEIIEDDLQIWAEHPVFGVGPGMARPLRHLYSRDAVAHTEYTRMLAEHGIFGLISIVILFMIAIRNFRKARSVEWKAVTGSLLLWSFVYMVINAMRLVGPSFLIGLTCAEISDEDELEDESFGDEVRK